jgi:antitoxin (DNA-binding transcriptional repressor) of toxin-antitoxin stability system
MRFITVRDLRGRSAEVWRRLSRDKDMVLTSNGRPIAILSATSEETLEESLAAIRQARAMRAVAAIQARSVEAGLDRMTLDEVNAEIEAVRKARRK